MFNLLRPVYTASQSGCTILHSLHSVREGQVRPVLSSVWCSSVLVTSAIQGGLGRLLAVHPSLCSWDIYTFFLKYVFNIFANLLMCFFKV